MTDQELQKRVDAFNRLHGLQVSIWKYHAIVEFNQKCAILDFNNGWQSCLESLDSERPTSPPVTLYHATTAKKAKLYRGAGRIIGPVRGFDTLMGAMAWAIKTGRKVIYRIDKMEYVPQLLPDHHNEFGRAYWTGTVTIDKIKCVYSGEGPRPQPDEVFDQEPKPEPQPTGVEARICKDITSRQQLGIQKYGTTVEENPLSLKDWLQHAYEESLDTAVYLKVAIEKIQNSEFSENTEKIKKNESLT